MLFISRDYSVRDGLYEFCIQVTKAVPAALNSLGRREEGRVSAAAEEFGQAANNGINEIITRFFLHFVTVLKCYRILTFYIFQTVYTTNLIEKYLFLF